MVIPQTHPAATLHQATRPLIQRSHGVAEEASAIGDRELTPDDIPRLGYTQQVFREAMPFTTVAAAPIPARVRARA